MTQYELLDKLLVFVSESRRYPHPPNKRTSDVELAYYLGHNAALGRITGYLDGALLGMGGDKVIAELDVAAHADRIVSERREQAGEEGITHEIEGHWTREPLKEPGTYFYTFKRPNGSWSTPSKDYLVEGSEVPLCSRRWSEPVDEWVPDLPKEGE